MKGGKEGEKSERERLGKVSLNLLDILVVSDGALPFGFGVEVSVLVLVLHVLGDDLATELV